MRLPRQRRPTHPGEVFLEEFINPLGLARFTGTEPEFWLNLQQARDLWDAQHSGTAADLEKLIQAVRDMAR